MDNERKLRLRRALEQDGCFLYELRNEKEVRLNSFHTEEIPYEKHIIWFGEKLKDPDTQIYILENEHGRIGQVRIDIADGKAEISYALCAEARGHGYSKWMLGELENKLCSEHWSGRLYAEVKQCNIASQHVFRTLQYKETESVFGYVYEKDIF